MKRKRSNLVPDEAPQKRSRNLEGETSRSPSPSPECEREALPVSPAKPRSGGSSTSLISQPAGMCDQSYSWCLHRRLNARCQLSQEGSSPLFITFKVEGESGDLKVDATDVVPKSAPPPQKVKPFIVSRFEQKEKVPPSRASSTVKPPGISSPSSSPACSPRQSPQISPRHSPAISPRHSPAISPRNEVDRSTESGSTPPLLPPITALLAACTLKSQPSFLARPGGTYQNGFTSNTTGLPVPPLVDNKIH